VATNSTIRRFFRTPKGLLIIVLLMLLALAVPHEGLKLIAPGLASAVIVASLIDVFVLRWLRGAWEFPSGAVLTGLLVAMVLTPYEPWYVAACTSALAIASKYVARTRSANVFNPAALALVVTTRVSFSIFMWGQLYVFHGGQSWWGALPEITPLALVVLFATGAFIADRVNKIPLVLVFLGSYFLLFTLTAFLSDPASVANIFRAPNLHAALFFAFFILTDPPTSPVKYPDQLIFAVIVAVASYVIFEWAGASYYLLAGVLVGNVWEAWNRWHSFSRQRLPSDADSRAVA
jgi:Na+-translocating ferredoxin:NAD+ oxidoreductase RnfD subunit